MIMLYHEVHTVRSLDGTLEGAQLTGVQEDLQERPDFICIHDNEDGTFIYSEWCTDNEVKFYSNNE